MQRGNNNYSTSCIFTKYTVILNSKLFQRIKKTYYFTLSTSIFIRNNLLLLSYAMCSMMNRSTKSRAYDIK